MKKRAIAMFMVLVLVFTGMNVTFVNFNFVQADEHVHDYGDAEPVFTWNGDSCTVGAIHCTKEGCNHEETPGVTVSKEEITKGSTGGTYTIHIASCMFNGKEYTSTNPATMASGTCDGNVKWRLIVDGTLLITGTGSMRYSSSGSEAPWYGYRNSIKEVVIESGITSIGARAFFNCTALENVWIPESVTEIGEEAFLYCSAMEEITLSDKTEIIGARAFYGCTSLKGITIPDKVETIEPGTFYGCTSLESVEFGNNVKTVGEGAFEGCESLKKAELPDGVTSLGAHAFDGCTGLEEVKVPDGVTEIGERTFYNCKSLRKAETGSAITKIGNEAFEYCGKLESVSLPGTLTEMGERAFRGCASLTEVEIPSGMEKIPDGAFDFCQNLQEIKIPASVKNVGAYAFANCAGAASVTIPEGVETIGDHAFDGCSKLSEVTVPASVTSLGEDAFRGCVSLKKIVIVGEEDATEDGPVLNAMPGEELMCYATALEASDGRVIGNLAFSGCGEINELYLPGDISRICDGAFKECKIDNIYYDGSKSSKQRIAIGQENDALINGVWHFSICEHCFVKTLEKIATHGEEGNIEYWYCSECDKYFSDEEGKHEIAKDSWITKFISLGTETANIVANEAEKLAVNNGAKLNVWAVAQDISNAIGEDVKSTIEKKAKELEQCAVVLDYLDINLYKELSTDEESTQVEETSELISVAIDVPSEVLKVDPEVKRGYYLARMHKGECELLKLNYDAESKTFNFTTDKFSTYAIIADSDSTETLIGDVNGNGEVNIVDAQLAYDISKGKYSDRLNIDRMKERGDVNTSGDVNALDARAIQYYVHNGGYAE